MGTNDKFKYNKLFANEMQKWNLSNVEIAKWINLSYSSVSQFRAYIRPMRKAYYALFKNILIQHLKDLGLDTPQAENAAPIKTTVKQKIMPLDYQDILDLYNKKLSQFGIFCRILNDQTKLNIKNRTTSGQYPLLTLEDWEAYFNYVKSSPFLRGEIPPNSGHLQFKVSLKWLVNASNFEKVMNGNYHHDK